VNSIATRFNTGRKARSLCKNALFPSAIGQWLVVPFAELPLGVRIEAVDGRAVSTAGQAG
jgi:hypothetical protein